jgi:N-dimethylarginine dimethylaminohydrolase
MKILISQLPNSPWWGKGVPMYDDNPAMRLGASPNQSLLRSERLKLISILNEFGVEVVELPFPTIFNTEPIKHDFVYIRDPFITNQNGKAVILRMKEPNRRGESTMAGQLLEKMGLEIVRIPDKPGLYAEGGEFYFCPAENILFSGQCRNSVSGMEAVAEALNVSELVIIQSHSYHLDTYFTPILDQEGHVCALILCMDIVSVKSSRDLRGFAERKNIPIIDIPLEDAIGTAANPGSFAANALPLPGVLIGPNHFSDRTIDDQLKEMGVKRIVTPTTQFELSGGSIHCITNEL